MTLTIVNAWSIMPSTRCRNSVGVSIKAFGCCSE